MPLAFTTSAKSATISTTVLITVANAKIATAVSFPKRVTISTASGVFTVAVTTASVAADPTTDQPAHSHRLGIRHTDVQTASMGKVVNAITMATSLLKGSNAFITAAYPVKPPVTTVVWNVFGIARLGITMDRSPNVAASNASRPARCSSAPAAHCGTVSSHAVDVARVIAYAIANAIAVQIVAFVLFVIWFS